MRRLLSGPVPPTGSVAPTVRADAMRSFSVTSSKTEAKLELLIIDFMRPLTASSWMPVRARDLSRVMCAMALALLALGIACSVPPSEECEQYIACVQHTDVVFDLPGTNTSAYAADGACWKDAEVAERCTEACTAALEDLRRALDLAGEPRGDCG